MPRVELVASDRHRRWRRFLRTARATWRDTQALWRQFRVPFLAFIIVTIGGGFLYGALHQHAGHDPIPYHNLPYLMVSLMILETPIEIPNEPYLIIFWYILPPIGAYIAGRGVVDFVRLFFDRSGRRPEWEEAVASTYRNHVIVLGVGHVGRRVIRWLARLGFEVVAIDEKLDADAQVELEQLGVPTILADGRQMLSLEKAGLMNAQSLVICTSDDLVNLQAAMRAREVRKDMRIIVRMWDSEFMNQIGVDTISASEISAPAFAGAAVGLEISHSITVNGVDYSTIQLEVQSGSFLDGQTIGQLQAMHEIDIVMHGCNGDVSVHPAGDIVVQPGDMLVLFARNSRVTDIAMRNRRANKAL